MTARDRILAKSPDVQRALRVLMTVDAVKEGAGLPWEQIAERQLAEWDRLLTEIGEQSGDWSEDAIARRIVEGCRRLDVWGRILRGSAN